MLSPILHPTPKARGPQSSRVKKRRNEKWKVKVLSDRVFHMRYAHHVREQYPVGGGGGGGGRGGGGGGGRAAGGRTNLCCHHALTHYFFLKQQKSRNFVCARIKIRAVNR
jgi:hypothetical protein